MSSTPAPRCCRNSAVRNVADAVSEHDLQNLVTEQANDEIVFLPECWAVIFRLHAQLVLRELGEHLNYLPSTLLERLREDAQKIH